MPIPAGKVQTNRDGQPGDTVSALGKKSFLFHLLLPVTRIRPGYLAPGISVLSAMTARAVLAALDNGKMRQQAAALSENERKAVAEWLTGSKLKSTVIPENAIYSIFASDNIAVLFTIIRAGVEIWRAQDIAVPNRQVSHSSNISSLKLKWVFAFPGCYDRTKQTGNCRRLADCWQPVRRSVCHQQENMENPDGIFQRMLPFAEQSLYKNKVIQRLHILPISVRMFTQ